MYFGILAGSCLCPSERKKAAKPLAQPGTKLGLEFLNSGKGGSKNLPAVVPLGREAWREYSEACQILEGAGNLLGFNLAVDHFQLGAPVAAALCDPQALDPDAGGEKHFSPILWD